MPTEKLQNCWVLQGMGHNQKLWLSSHTATASLSNSDSSTPKSSPAVTSIAGKKTSCFLSIPQVSCPLVLNILFKLASLRRLSTSAPKTDLPIDSEKPSTARPSTQTQGGKGEPEAVTPKRQALNGQSPEAKADRKIIFPFAFPSPLCFVQVEAVR